MQPDLTGAEGGVALPSLITDAQWRGAPAAAEPGANASSPDSGSGIAVFGLVVLIAAVLGVVLYGAAGSTVVGAHPGHIFPSWEAGPLRGILPKPLPSHMTGELLYSIVTAAAVLAYLLVLSAWRSLRMWQVAAFVLISGVILLLGPPDRLNDVFNYLGYARLGALHGLNPYTHVIANERSDSVFLMTSWRNLRSPYGPLFTALTYPLALLPLSVAYWELKIAILAASFGFLYCVYLCAVRMGRDPRWVILFVAANPLYLFYELAGFHNDFLMLLPSMGAVALMLSGRERSSGAALAVAVAVKFTTVVLLPFLLIAAWRRGKLPRVLEGIGLAAVPLFLMEALMFGLALPNTADQSQLATPFSIPNLAGLALGFGGASHGVILGCELVAAVICAAALWKYRRGNWVQGAGWAQIALIGSLAWLMPWYLVWALPLVALVESQSMRRVALVLTCFVFITFLPVTGQFLQSHGVNPQATAIGRKDRNFQVQLQWATQTPHHEAGPVEYRAASARPESPND